MTISYRSGIRYLAIAAIASSTACSGGGLTQAPATRSAASLTTRPAVAHGDTAYALAHLDRSRRAAKASWLDRTTFDATMHDALFERDSSGTPTSYLLYASNTDNGTIDIYQSNLPEPQTQNQPMIGQISVASYPGGLAADTSGDLYVVNFYDPSLGTATITEYTPGSMPNSTGVVREDSDSPEGVAIAPNGDLYVADNGMYNQSTGTFTGSRIAVYPPGRATPSKTLTSTSATQIFDYVCADKNGNLYVNYYDTSVDEDFVGEFAKGSTTLQTLGLSNQGYDPHLDSNGDLLAEDHTTGLVNLYPNGSTTASRSFQLQDADFGFFALSYSGGQVYGTSGYSSSPAGTSINEYRFTTGVLDNTISGATTYEFGLVTAPAAAYPPPYSAGTSE